MHRRAGLTMGNTVMGRAVVLALFVLLLWVLTGSVAADSFVVIVNDAGPVSALSAQEISDLFLGKSAKWSDGTAVAPVDLSESSPARASFTRRVHGKGVTAIKSYWQKMIFSGRAVPPPEKGSPADVVAFVRAQRGAIGYVPPGTPLGAGVKIVSVN